MKSALLLLCVLLAGCSTVRQYPKPDPSIVVWGVADPKAAAWAHAMRIYGTALVILPTGSMEPYLTGGDYVVGDFSIPWKDIKPGKTLLYDANWLDYTFPLCCHMAVERTGPGWVMTGIANRYSEAGSRALMEADYRATVVAVYTSRKKQF